MQNDPDIEPVLALFFGFVIPLLTVLCQSAIDHRRAQLQDQRLIRRQILNIRHNLDIAEDALVFIEEIVSGAGLWREPIHPAGNHGIVLSDYLLDQYQRMVADLAIAMRDIDNSAMELSSMIIVDEIRDRVLHELAILQDLLHQANASDKYGEKVRYLKWSFRQSQSVLLIVERGLDHYRTPL